MKKAAVGWFDSVKPALVDAGFSPGTISHYSSKFELMLKQSRSKPSKTYVYNNLTEITQNYSNDIIHQIEIGSFTPSDPLSITPFIDGLESVEREYLAEAQRCLAAGALRGCVVMGWCAAIARMHAKIEEIGFDKFTKASKQIKAKTTGRYKFIKKEFEIDSLSELQTVFDTDLLWVLEFLELIDSNQHQRLRSCFEMRNHAGHPGQAPTEPANVYSFYSDISKIVLKNEKFMLANPTSS